MTRRGGQLLLDSLMGILPVALLLAFGVWCLTWLLEDWPFDWPTQLAVVGVVALGLAAGACLVALIVRPRPLRPEDILVRAGRVLLPVGTGLALIPGLGGLLLFSSVNSLRDQTLFALEALSSALAVLTSLRYIFTLRHLGGRA